MTRLGLDSEWLIYLWEHFVWSCCRQSRDLHCHPEKNLDLTIYRLFSSGPLIISAWNFICSVCSGLELHFCKNWPDRHWPHRRPWNHWSIRRKSCYPWSPWLRSWSPSGTSESGWLVSGAMVTKLDNSSFVYTCSLSNALVAFSDSKWHILILFQSSFSKSQSYALLVIEFIILLDHKNMKPMS